MQTLPGQHPEPSGERVSFADRAARRGRRAVGRGVGGENRRRRRAARALLVGRRRRFEFFKVPRAGDQAEADRLGLVAR